MKDRFYQFFGFTYIVNKSNDKVHHIRCRHFAGIKNYYYISAAKAIAKANENKDHMCNCVKIFKK